MTLCIAASGKKVGSLLCVFRVSAVPCFGGTETPQRRDRRREEHRSLNTTRQGIALPQSGHFFGAQSRKKRRHLRRKTDNRLSISFCRSSGGETGKSRTGRWDSAFSCPQSSCRAHLELSLIGQRHFGLPCHRKWLEFHRLHPTGPAPVVNWFGN